MNLFNKVTVPRPFGQKISNAVKNHGKKQIHLAVMPQIPRQNQNKLQMPNLEKR